MSTEITLHHRRKPLPGELAAIAWLAVLAPVHRERAVQDMHVGEALSGDVVCRSGRPATCWLGVVDGLLQIGRERADGRRTTLTGVPPGGWFGEGTALKRESYRYDVQALRKSTVVGLPVDTFHWLLDQSIGFNRFVMHKLNERLGQIMAARAIDHVNDPDARVARSLAALFNPVLHPGVGGMLRITQQELARLAGLSRQRVNESLNTLQAQGAIRVEYGGVRMLHLDALRPASFSSALPAPVPPENAASMP